jgi:A/G-specific adenine glycosylase
LTDGRHRTGDARVPDAAAAVRAFRTRLAEWFDREARKLPWRRTDDPYRIWLSEVILQQTRVDQGRAYYDRFVGRFPTVHDLATASLDDVLKTWEGLGYYSRARNLHAAARMVVDHFDGHLPDTVSELKRLPGVGPYTAAAIASIAFGRPAAVLDGNVIRVIARLASFGEDVTRSAARRRLQSAADTLLDAAHPGAHNEAMMELGALICTPTSPACGRCPVSDPCSAFAEGTQESYPVKRRRTPIPHYDIAVGIIRHDDGRVLIQKRPVDAMLGGLWEFPGGKREADEEPEDTVVREIREELGVDVSVDGHLSTLDHAYSHFRITLHAYLCSLNDAGQEPSSPQPIEWVTREALAEYAFPRANRRLIETLISGDDDGL